MQRSPVRGKGGWMTNDVRESGGNEINFSSSRADLTSRRERTAVLPHYETKQSIEIQHTEPGPKDSTIFLKNKIF